MNQKNVRQVIFVLALFALSLVWIGESQAGSLTLTLERQTLTNVSDAAGLWQHEGGKVFRSGIQVGNYAATRRVTTGGTNAQNTAMFTMTIFMLGSAPPSNITLEGSHDFSSGRYVGSVSAASNLNNWLIGADFVGTAGASGTLTIQWTGSNGLTIR